MPPGLAPVRVKFVMKYNLVGEALHQMLASARSKKAVRQNHNWMLFLHLGRRGYLWPNHRYSVPSCFLFLVFSKSLTQLFQILARIGCQCLTEHSWTRGVEHVHITQTSVGLYLGCKQILFFSWTYVNHAASKLFHC